MIARVIIQGFPATDYVLENGVKNLSFEIQDEEGRLTIPEVTIQLSNLDNAFLTYIIAPPTGIIVVSMSDPLTGASYSLFRGRLKPGGFKYNPDTEIMELQCLNNQEDVLNTMKSLRLKELPLTQYKRILPIEDDTLQGSAKNRIFYGVMDIIKLILVQSGVNLANAVIQWNGNDDQNFVFGGVQSDSTALTVPDVSCYDFFMGCMKTFNSLWWFNQQGYLYVVNKQGWLKTVLNAPLPVELIDESASINNDVISTDSLEIKYKNADKLKDNRWAIASIQRSGTIVQTKSIEPFFIAPDLGTYLITQTRASNAMISASDSANNNYLVYHGGSKGRQNGVVPAQYLLERYFQCEIQSGIAISFKHTMMDNESFLSGFPFPYARLTGINVPNAKFHLRKAEIDLEAEQISMEAMSYA